jgi:hypothetical protein
MKKALITIGTAAAIGIGCLMAVRGETMAITDSEHPLLGSRVGIAWDITGKQHTVAYVPMVYVVGSNSKLEYATFNIGVVDKMANGKVGYVASLGFRLDTVFDKLGRSAFAQKYLLFAVLPPVQISPCFVSQDFKKFIPMITIATKFGK